MIISRTPLRISLFGGGSDLPWFYEREQGAVVSLAISKYIYISVNELFDSSDILLKYSNFERVRVASDLKHQIVREILCERKMAGLDISVNSDIPAGTGMGSSSSFTVGLINVIEAKLGNYLDAPELASQGSNFEINYLKEPVGKQDHYAAAYGGLNKFEFMSNGKVSVQKYSLTEAESDYLESCLLLVRVGNVRFASEILGEMKANSDSDVLRESISQLAEVARSLTKDDLFEPEKLGTLLTRSWDIKKSTHPHITNSEIEGQIRKGLLAGATGAKLLGAGSAGFILFVCPPELRMLLASRFEHSKVICPKMDNEGSVIIYRE
jgi:D-glycero-alpha-D-manno-heptose-7-phosphate kinase